MELNKKEKYLKTVLENSDYKLDTDLLWDSIESKVQKPDRDRKWLWFLSGMGSLALILAITFPFVKNHILAEAKKSDLISEINIKNEHHNSGNHSYSEANNNSDNQDLTQYINTELIENINTNSSINTYNELTSKTAATQNLKSSNLQNKETTADLVNTKSMTSSSSNLTTPESSSNQNTKSNISATKTNLIASISLNEDVETRLHESSLEKRNSKMSYKGFIENTKQPIFMTSLLDLRHVAIPEIKFNKYAFSPPSVIKVNRPTIWVPFIAIRGGVGLTKPQSSLTIDESLMHSEEFNRETGVYGFSLDLQFGLENNKGWYLLSGIDINDKVVRYENYSNQQSSTSGSGVISIYTDRDGKIEESQGQVNQINVTNYNRKWYRSHKAINIQFIVGKELVQIGRFSLSTELGVHYNIYSSHSGYYFEDTQDAWVSFESGDATPYKSSTGLGLRGGINLNYHFNNISLGLHSYYKYDPRSLTNADYFYHSNNNQIGLQLGVAYQLKH